MNDRLASPAPDSSIPGTDDGQSAEPSSSALTHPVLSRLLDEVRNERGVEAAYDRVHNRHNRGR